MITLEEKEVLSQCLKCVKRGCEHKDCFRRLAREHGGLELCYNIAAAKENKREFAVIERYFDYGKCECYIAHYTTDEEKESISGKHIYNEACYDQYITYDLNIEEVQERLKEIKNL